MLFFAANKPECEMPMPTMAEIGGMIAATTVATCGVLRCTAAAAAGPSGAVGAAADDALRGELATLPPPSTQHDAAPQRDGQAVEGLHEGGGSREAALREAEQQAGRGRQQEAALVEVAEGEEEGDLAR